MKNITEITLTDIQKKHSLQYAPHITDTVFVNGKRVPRMVPMLTESLCFQPMQEKYNFKKILIN